MSITQVSIAVDNAPGSLYRASSILEKEQINIKAIMAATGLSPVQVHMIVDDPDRAVKVLEMNGFTVSTKEVIAVAAPDHPGGLNAYCGPSSRRKSTSMPCIPSSTSRATRRS